MTVKVNGAAYPGVWVEKNTAIIKVTFSTTILALTPATGGLLLEGTSTAVTGTATATSAQGIVDSVLVQALKVIATKATILAVSPVGGTGTTVDVLVGHAEGWIAAANDGLLSTTASTGYAISPAKAVITAVGGGNSTLGATVDVGAAATTTFGLRFAKFDGTATIAASTDLAAGPGLAAGSAVTPMGGTGYYMINGAAGVQL
jgi:hypothetical protein